MKKTQKWQVFVLVLFVVLGLGLGIPMAQQRGTEDRAASMKWEQNSDGLVFIKVVTKLDLSKVPEMPIYLVAQVLLKDEPTVALEIHGNTFVMYFPPAGETKTLTTEMILDFRKAVRNFAVLIKDIGVPTGAAYTIYVRHEKDRALGWEERDGKVWHIADLVQPIRLVDGNNPFKK